MVGLNNKSNRDTWLSKTLSDIPSGSKILDAGAGELRYKGLCKHLEYVSQDFAKYDGQGDTSGLQTGTWDNSKLDIISDITDIPVKKASFDAIMCTEVFEHIPYPDRAVKEFARILKPKGKLIITAPFASLTHFAPYFYSNGYSKYWYEKVLTDYGFKILDIDFNGNYFDYVAQEIRRIKSVEGQYSKTLYSNQIIYVLAKKILLKLLDKINTNSNGSEELLCMGVHVLAEKLD